MTTLQSLHPAQLSIRVSNSARRIGLVLTITLLGASCQKSGGLSHLPLPVTPETGSSNRIVFAGLSGNSPKYIESGPYKGLGWVENQTLAVRNGLLEDGFDVQQDWMTNSRMAYEFRSQHPICTYPVEWKLKDQDFSTKPDRILSIPLDLTGEVSRSIMIRKEDLPKFKKHLDPKGDLLIRSLIEDVTLKTLLVKDRDYGSAMKSVIETDKTGDQRISRRYEGHIDLRVIRDSKQLIEMLNAKRFDYIFSSEIEEGDLELTKIDKTNFIQLNYETLGVSNAKDPNLVLVSVACAIHPLTLKAMPYINKWIARHRGLDWVIAQIGYRRKMDSNYLEGEVSYTNKVMNKLSGEFLGGRFDEWALKQASHFPGLPLFPKQGKSETLALPTLPPATRSPHWIAFSEEPGAWTILNSSFRALLQAPYLRRPGGGLLLRLDPYPRRDLKSYFSQKQLRIAESDNPLSSSFFSWSGKRNPFADQKEIQKLTLVASGLGKDDLESLKNILQSEQLTSLTAVEASPEVSARIVELLPKSLKHLNLTSCLLFQSTIETKVKGLSLDSLHVNNSQLTPNQLTHLIENLPPSLSELSLGFLRSAWEHKAIQAFAHKKFTDLHFLDIENSHLQDDFLFAATQSLGANLKTLRAASNAFTPQGIRPFLRRSGTHLVTLDLSGSIVAAQRGEPTVLPTTLQNLTLDESGLTSQSFQNLILPEHLLIAGFSHNKIGDLGFQRLFKSLGPNATSLDLSATAISQKAVESLASANGIRHLEFLFLDDNALEDQALEALASAPLTLKGLSLRSNKLTDASAALIARKWLAQLQTLDLSENFISQSGVRALSQAIRPGLLQLQLEGVLGLDVPALAKALPRGLRSLNLASSYLSGPALSTLVQKLPRGLNQFSFDASNTSIAGALTLAKNIPSSLYSFELSGTSYPRAAIPFLLSALPDSLGNLSLSQIKINGDQEKRALKDLPPHLTELSLIDVGSEKEGISPVFEGLPKSLVRISLGNLGLSNTSARTLDAHWPTGLRRLYLNGVRIDNSTFATLIQNIPKGIEWVGIRDAHLADTSLLALAKQPLENLDFLSIHGSSFSAKAMRAWSQTRHHKGMLVFNATQLPPEAIDEISAESLSTLRYFILAGVKIPRATLERLLKRLPKELEFLQLSSTGLSYQGLDQFIALLPPRLHHLNIAGNPLGQAGLEKLRAYKAKRELEEGIPFALQE